MRTMRIMRFSDSQDASDLIAGTAPLPNPGEGEILVRVHAVGVTPTESQWYPTTHTQDGGIRTGAIPGHEFSGVIEAVGVNVDPSQIGRAVYGMNDWFADGATADYCVSVLEAVADKPPSLSHLEAASVPIGALTAWQGLFARAKLRRGERILVHGGSGAVGLFAIQLARRAGAHVITTASARNFELLSQLGADQMIDYTQERFEEHTRDIDVVFDTVGGETLKRSWDLLKPTGRMVTIAADSERTKEPRTEQAFFIVEPDSRQLAEISRLLDSGEVRCFVDAVVPMARAAEAYSRRIEGRRGYGKVVISVTTG